ncbi:hypothetical protein D3C72_2238530 [compost metagenome]
MRTSTVPYSGLGRMSQYRSFRLPMMPACFSSAAWPWNSCQLRTNCGRWPLLGKALTTLLRAEAKPLSSPCM